MICYRIVDGIAQDIRFVPEDYVAQPGEVLIEGDELPSPESLAPPPLDRVKQMAKVRIDDAAGRARARYITVAPGQEATYQAKAAEADAYVAAGRPADTTSYPILAAEAQARGITVSQLADLVRATRDQWIQLAAAIEAARIGGKLAVDAATDVSGAQAAAGRVIAQLDVL